MLLKKIIRIFAWTIGSVVVLCGIIFLIAWKSPKYYNVSRTYDPIADSIIPFKYYPSINNHPRPYIIRSNNQYCIFGAQHTRDPENTEIKIIEKEWNDLKPTIALVEGRLGFLLPGLMDPVKTLGEGGKVKALAGKNDIPVYNWDLPKEMLAKQLLKKFTAEQIALAQILNPYFSELRFGKPASPEKFIEEFMYRAKYVGQENNLRTAADIDNAWKKYFPTGPDWKNVNDQEGLPGFLNDMAAFSNDLRNQQLVLVIKELVSKGEKVFAICGSSHAACVATAFNK